MRVRKVFAVLGTLLALAAVVPSGAGAAGDTQKQGTKKPTIVLVHGAFADASSWNGVVKRLQRKGFPVVAVANPLRSVTGDANYLRQVLASIEGPIVLAGHSYGGMVQSAAALGNPNVKALVYVAAFAPEKGESALELSNKFPGSTLGDTVSTIDIGDGSKDLTIQQDKYWQQFAADVSRRDATPAAATQRPINDTALTEKAGEPAWHTVPSYFVVAGKDKNIPIAAQKWMAERAHARAVVEVKGASHSVAVSQPDTVADLIVRAAR
ncbi:Pimeloyl-ACP methyl ester carboxylesterase [Lentzea albidocapillata subsp. violacea]|uniref:Pimeloyl-ACP methyl ester carboxylesterase n=1 Tax=Lentzea albidocapillata subsp. violacea TaxID=128104 RepID=A0A1G9BL71_9PSEU|nr:alpha/beta hydrolase [Lentzea albidocapillata]SDK40232.1 Pimeloyl-ACP methyl ester carboxylesterase [Lentzea albidocapillata subsp. violacea]